MAPAEQACKLYSNVLEASSQLIKTIQDIRKSVKKLIEARSKILYGIINVADVASGELIASASAIASTISSNIFGNISKLASGTLQLILSQLLKILLAFPTSVFSLVAIPHEQAIIAVMRERKYLLKAQLNVKNILSIASKWSVSIVSSDFYAQMKIAIPHVESAIEYATSLIKGLESGVFNESIYNDLRSEVLSAINITKPRDKFNINEAIEADRKKRFSEKKRIIINDYNEKIKSLDNKYMAMKESEKRNLSWSTDKEVLNYERDSRLSLADSQAMSEAMMNGDNYKKQFSSIASRFQFDMSILQEESVDLVKNIGRAYLYNKTSQSQCNTIYNIRFLITKLINELMSLIRSSSLGAVEIALNTIDGVKSILEISDEKMTEAVEKYEQSSSINMSSTLSLSHGILTSADAIMAGNINQSLIDIINADDVLNDSNEEFQNFLQRLYHIPDWDGKSGVWSVDYLNGAQSPYIKLVTDLPSLVSVPQDENGKRGYLVLLSNINNAINLLLRHNSYVLSALRSYVPYVSSEAGNLKRILSNAGLTESFASTLSIADLISDIAITIKDVFDSEIPTIKNCKASYPSLFKNPSANTASACNRVNISPTIFNLEAQDAIENKEIDLISVREQLKNANFDIPQSSLTSAPDPTIESV